MDASMNGFNIRMACKAVAFAISVAVVAPLVALSWVEKRISGGEALFLLGNQLLAVFPGFIGRSLRGAYYFGTLEHCSWEVHIGFGTLFTHRAALVGSRVSTGAYCVIGHAELGEGVMIGSRVSIPSGRRQHLDASGRLSGTEGRFETVRVGGGTWIGEGAILLADVGSRCIVSAGAVVTKQMPDGYLIAGNPAQMVRRLEPDGVVQTANASGATV